MSKPMIILLGLVIFGLVLVACGSDDATPAPGATSTPAPTSTPQPTATPVDVGAIASGLQEALKQTVEQALAQQAGDAQEPITQQDLEALVQRAVEASVPEGTNPLEIRRMVEEAVKATAQEGLTREDVASLVAEAVSEAAAEGLTAEDVQRIVSQAVATPTPLPAAAVTFEWVPPAFASGAKQGGVMPMSVLTWRVEWDPHQGSALTTSAINSGFWNQLIRFDYEDRDKLMGDLVKTWELTPEGGYIFKIHEGATFLDGETVNADDVKWSLDRMVETGEGIIRPKTSKLRQYMESSEIVDDRTVKINMKIPGSPAFLQYLTVEQMKVLPKHLEDAHPDPIELQEFLLKTENINGSGPFMFKSFQEGVVTEWVRNPNYWKEGMPFLDGIQMFLIEDSARVIASFAAGQVLMPNFGDTGLGVRDLLAADKEWGDQVRLHWLGDTNLDVFIVNFEVPPFDDPKVRSALYIGMDRLAHIDTLLVGRGKFGTPFFPGTWMTPSDEVVGTWPGFRYVDKHTGEPVLVPYGRDDVVKDPRDIAKAKALLEEAGYTEDNPLKLTFNNFSLAYHSTVAQFLQQQFKTFGVETTLEPRDVSTGFAESIKGNYQVFHITRSTHIIDSDELLLGNYLPGGVPIWKNIEIPRVTEIFELSSRESDPGARQNLIWEAGEILRQGELSMLGIAWIDRYALPVNTKVKNYHVGKIQFANLVHESIWLDDPSEFR
jgi:peptide/nickel transport system substrate-binding protein